MEKKTNNPGSGGQRPGSGRKTDAVRKNLLLRIDVRLIEKMKDETSKSRLIEKLLKEYYNLSEK